MSNLKRQVGRGIFFMNAKRSIPVVAIVTAICLLGDTMLYIVLPVYWQEAGLRSFWEVGVLLSINRFVRLPLNPFIGWLYNKISLRTGLMIAVLLAAFTTSGYGLFKGFLFWLILRCLWGLAWSLIRMGGYFTVIGYSDDSNRGKWMGTYNGISRLGGLAGMLAGGILVPIFGLPVIAISFGIITLSSFPVILMYISNKKVNEDSPPERDWLVHLWSKPVIKI